MAVCAQNILTFFPDTYLRCQTSLHMNHNEFQPNITFILSVFLLDVTLLPGSQRPNAHIQWPPVSDKFFTRSQPWDQTPTYALLCQVHCFRNRVFDSANLWSRKSASLSSRKFAQARLLQTSRLMLSSHWICIGLPRTQMSIRDWHASLIFSSTWASVSPQRGSYTLDSNFKWDWVIRSISS